MPRLHLLRHAKSGYPDGVEDHERPLARRGREAARSIGRHLAKTAGDIDLVLCSTAVRARETLNQVLLGFDERPTVRFEDGLYLASATALLRRLRQLDESCDAVLVVGHNPGLHELALALADPETPGHVALSGKFPAGARASFIVASSWATLQPGQQKLIDYVTPKSLSDAD